MYQRIFKPPTQESYFLLGPRGTGKSWLVRQLHADALYIDLLKSSTYNRLLAAPDRLAEEIPADFQGWVIIDEIQKIPALLDEVHRLIEMRRLKFVLTGSSARSLKRKGANLLGGRALTLRLHPLTAEELGADFDLVRALRYGQMPLACRAQNPARFLQSYVRTYLQEEIQQEGLTRKLDAFSRFLEAASFSQAAPLNTTAIARECATNRKVVENYFGILKDTLISCDLPVFNRRAKRRLLSSVKFYFFDAGVFRAVRPSGPLDTPQEIDGAALETLILQNIRAQNDYRSWDYRLHYWRTAQGAEVDFVLYGERGLKAIEVKSSSRPPSRADLRGLSLFMKDHPEADAMLLYAGKETLREGNIAVVPATDFLLNMSAYV